MEERYQVRVLGIDENGDRTALAIELPYRCNQRQITRYKVIAKDRFYKQHPSGYITSVKRVAMGPREESTS